MLRRMSRRREMPESRENPLAELPDADRRMREMAFTAKAPH